MLKSRILPAINFLEDINPSLIQSMEGVTFKPDPPLKKYFLSTSIKSINSASLLFTNFLSSKECKEYKLLKNLHDKFLRNPDALDGLFYSTEQERSNQQKNKRLYDIFIGTGVNKRLVNNKLILKYKLQNQRGINVPLRIYARRYKNKVFILLIDLYHMAWISPHPVTKKEDPVKLYNAHKRHSYCIGNI